LEQLETRDLPGNDASWYRALLVDDNNEAVVAGPPEQQSPSLETDPIAEESATDPDVALVTAEAHEPDPQPESQLEFEPEADLESVPESQLESEPETDPEPDPEPEPEPEPETEHVAGQADDPVVSSPSLSGETDPVQFPEKPKPVDEPAAAADNGAQEDSAPLITSVQTADQDQTLDNTSEMVGQLWTSTEPETAFEAWEPDEMDDKINSSRPFRWTSVIAGLAVIALIVVGLVLLPQMTQTRADSHRNMMVDTLHELRAELPDTQSSLQAATEPSSNAESLSALSTQLTVLTARASDVDEAARTPLPTAPPFTSTAPIEDLAPIQQRLEPLATTAQTIQRRISNLAQYRILMSGFLVLPELPPTADTATQADLRVVLASAQAESASILAELPSDVSLSEHQDFARSISESFATWQIDYLEALRTQDPPAAGILVENLTTQLAELDTQLVNPLAQIRRQTDTDLIDLARSIDEVIALASATPPLP
jgi:hypothetical protein